MKNKEKIQIQFPDNILCITSNHLGDAPQAVAALIEQLEPNKVHFHGFCMDCYMEYAGVNVNHNWFVFKNEEIKDKIIHLQINCKLCKLEYEKSQMVYQMLVDEKGFDSYFNICTSCYKTLKTCSRCGVKTKEYFVYADKGKKLHLGQDYAPTPQLKILEGEEKFEALEERAKYNWYFCCKKCFKQSVITCFKCEGNYISDWSTIDPIESNYKTCLACWKNCYISCSGCGFITTHNKHDTFGFKTDLIGKTYCEKCILIGHGNFPVDVLKEGYCRVFEHNTEILKVLPHEQHGDLYKNKGKSRLFGIELEFVTTTGKKSDLDPIKDMYRRMKGRGLVLRDGSIMPEHKGTIESYGFGFEVVSVPMEMGNMMEFIDDIIDGNKFITDHKTCGIHIHTNRNKVTSTQIAKMLLFGRSPFNYEFISKIAERYIGPHYKYSPLDNRSHKELMVPVRTGSGGVKMVIQDTGNHYHWLNLNKRTTIEFRIFASSTNLGKIKKDIEFVDALLDVTEASNYKFQDFYIPNKFLDYISEKRKLFPNLFAFIDGVSGFEKYKVVKDIGKLKFNDVRLDNTSLIAKSGVNPFDTPLTTENAA